MKIFFSIFLLLTLCLTMHSQNIRILHGRLVDFATNGTLPDSTIIDLLNNDSTPLSTDRAYNNFDGFNSTTEFNVEVENPGKYILCFRNRKFHTKYKNVEVKFYKRERTIELGVIPMSKRLITDEHELDEVVVKATKLKFYFSKDTLVYDASLFTTQKGSMLNDILHKMPGLEIKDNGEIYSNGRKVDALLLNGKDFFNRDRKTLLENMPAYAVKNIKIYDKTKDSTSLIRRERELTGYVMDVRLKKGYESSAIVNTDLGYGANKRYYGKAVGLTYNPYGRLSAYAFSNNINRSEMPGNGDSFSFTNTNGEYVMDKAGMSYNIDNPQGVHTFEGNVETAYTDGYNQYRTTEERFLNGGNTFSREVGKSNDYDFEIITKHTLNFYQNMPLSFTVSPSFSYSVNTRNSNMRNAVFNHDITPLWGDAWADSLWANNYSNASGQYGINYQSIFSKGKNKQLNFKLQANKSIKIPHTEDELNLDASYSFEKNTMRNIDWRQVSYLKTAKEDKSDLYSNISSRANEWNASGSYSLYINSSNKVNLQYSYSDISTHHDNPIYSLELLPDFDLDNYTSFDKLPSQIVLSNVVNNNAYRYNQHDNKHTIETKYTYNMQKNYHQSDFSFSIPLNIVKRNMDYHRALYDTIIARSITAPDITTELQHQYSNFSKRSYYMYSLQYTLTHEMPALLDIVSITSDVNPLYVSIGNAHLDNTRQHQMFGQFFWQTTKGNVHRVNLNCYIRENDIARAQVFDNVSGVTYITPRNINGNRAFSINFVNEVFLKTNRQIKATNNLKMTWRRISDYISTSTLKLTDYINRIHNFNLQESIGGKYTSNNTKLNIEGQAFLIYNRVADNNTKSDKKNLYTYGVVCKGTIELPLNLKLQADINAFNRSGFEYSAFNKTQFLFNASLSKAFGEKLSAKVEWNDIFKQRNFATRAVDATGVKDTRHDSLHSYVMFHIIYRFMQKK